MPDRRPQDVVDFFFWILQTVGDRRGCDRRLLGRYFVFSPIQKPVAANPIVPRCLLKSLNSDHGLVIRRLAHIPLYSGCYRRSGGERASIWRGSFGRFMVFQLTLDVGDGDGEPSRILRTRMHRHVCRCLPAWASDDAVAWGRHVRRVHNVLNVVDGTRGFASLASMGFGRGLWLGKPDMWMARIPMRCLVDRQHRARRIWSDQSIKSIRR